MYDSKFLMQNTNEYRLVLIVLATSIIIIL